MHRESPVRDAVDSAAWLRDLGLERYAQAFRDNDVDVDLLSDLSEADLEKTSTCSAMASASSTSMPRYLTVLSTLAWPRSN
jgi:hypothetical protein